MAAAPAMEQTPRPGPRSSPSLPLAPFYPSTVSHHSFPEATLPNYRAMGHKIPVPEHANPSAWRKAGSLVFDAEPVRSD